MPQIFLYKKNSPTQATGIHGKLFFTMLGLLASTAPSGGGLAGWKFQKDLFFKKSHLFIFVLLVPCCPSLHLEPSWCWDGWVPPRHRSLKNENVKLGFLYLSVFQKIFRPLLWEGRLSRSLKRISFLGPQSKGKPMSPPLLIFPRRQRDWQEEDTDRRSRQSQTQRKRTRMKHTQSKHFN